MPAVTHSCRLLVMLAPILAACGAGEPSEIVPHPTGVKILLVGIDGATLSLLEPLAERGELPNFQALMDRGSRGVLHSVTPMKSPALWTEILTGQPREKHGIEDFVVRLRPDERVTVEGEDPKRSRLVSSNDRRRLALWNILSGTGLDVGIVGFWATWPAEPVRGFLVSDRITKSRFTEWHDGQAESNLVFPPDLLAELEDLRFDPDSIERSVVDELVRFNDAEWAEFQAVERPLFQHGISVFKYGYGSQRAMEAIAMKLIPRDQPDLAGVFLIANDPICHTFWHHFEPEAFGEPETETSRRLGGIVPGIYRHNDAYIGELVAQLDPDTVVFIVSDHGFQASGELPESVSAEEYSDDLREASLALGRVAIGQSGAHRPDGLILVAGGPIKHGVPLDAQLVDVTPTILALLGLPVPDDMPGRVLEEMFDPEFLVANPLRRIPSYEDVIARVLVDTEAPLDDEDMMEQLRALGYVR